MKYLTRKNIGWLLTVLLALPLLGSVAGKLSGAEEMTQMLSSHNLGDWMTIIGLGELASLILFIIPKTMRFGTLLLSAYFGGAIIFHMAHPDPAQQAFVGPVAFLVIIWIISGVRGFFHDHEEIKTTV